MRLFIAIDLPESQGQLVASLAPDGLKGAKAVPMHQLHLTLRFLGEVSEPRLPELSAALRDISFLPFSLRLQSIGTFPNSKRPRVLWLGIEENPALLDLQGRIEAAVQSVGLTPESRPFAPHFTLARFKFGAGRELEDYLNRHREFSGDAWQAEEFRLYSSVLGQKGATHEILQRYPALPSAR